MDGKKILGIETGQPKHQKPKVVSDGSVDLSSLEPTDVLISEGGFSIAVSITEIPIGD